MSPGPRVTWIGHSTVLVELDGMRLITDPLLRRRVKHLWRRVPLPGARPEVDATLISHIHWDHLDLKSLALLGRSTRLVVPRGAGRYLGDHGYDDVVELAVGESTAIGPLRIEATEAVHDIGRLRRKARSPALGFVIHGRRTVYFAGDTDVFEGMRALGDLGLDLAVLPIGGWGPSVPEGHLNPERAAQAAALLRPRIVVPVHYGTYTAFGRDQGTDPAAEFLRDAQELAPETDVRILSVGAGLEF